MSLRLPPAGSSLRELFDVADLAEMASPENRSRIPFVGEMADKASQMFAADPAAVTLNAVVRYSNGRLGLVQFARIAKPRHLWDFGELFKAVDLRSAYYAGYNAAARGDSRNHYAPGTPQAAEFEAGQSAFAFADGRAS